MAADPVILQRAFVTTPMTDADLDVNRPINAPPAQSSTETAVSAAGTVTVTPLEMGGTGPVHWTIPATRGAPPQITIAVAQYNYPNEGTLTQAFSAPLPAAFQPLLTAAEDYWEAVANIQFVPVIDVNSALQGAIADVRVGQSDLSAHLNAMTIGFTHYRYSTTTNEFLSDTTVTIEDITAHPVTALANGDYQYNGTGVTVFQDFLHELGHALGLNHNLNDIHSIMYPTLTRDNPYLDQNDVLGIQSLYGPPSGSVGFTTTEWNNLQALVYGTPTV